MKVNITIGCCGSQDCSLILNHGTEYWEFLIESPGWKVLAYEYKLGLHNISLKEFHRILKLWRNCERPDDIADAS